MRINFVAVSLIISVNTLAAADNVSVIGDRATDVSADAWKDIANFPTNTSTSKFTGFNISKAYPSSEQDGWQLTINVKEDVKGPNGNITATVMSITSPSNRTIDSSWHFCTCAFNVKATSAAAYFSGQKDSCNNLVSSECIDDLKKNAARNSATSGCKAYSTTPGCLRNLDEQSAKALSLSCKFPLHTPKPRWAVLI